jgi:hypothetical protein
MVIHEYTLRDQGQVIQSYIDGNHSGAFASFHSENPGSATAAEVGWSAIDARNKQRSRKARSKKTAQGDETADDQTVGAPSTAASKAN